MRWILLLVASVVTLPACSMNDCCPDVTAFDGITETDDTGEVVGTVDRSDWQPAAGSEGGAPTTTVTPASPNPATSAASLGLTLTEPDRIAITIQRENTDAPVVTVLRESELAAGSHRLLIERPATAPGLFRITVVGRSFSTVGDIRFE